VIITGPVPTQADITVGTIFTGKALALDISALTMGKVTAIGVTATGVIRTEGMATGVIRAGIIRTEVMVMGIPMRVMAMEVIQMGATPTVVMAMEVIPTGVRPARATRNGLAGTAQDSSFGRHTRQDRVEVTMHLGRPWFERLPARFFAPGRTRTCNPMIRSHTKPCIRISAKVRTFCL
jgi:hypothetical protein